MRFAAPFFVVAVVLAPAGAQIQIPSTPASSVAAKPATGTVGGDHSPMALAMLTAAEKDINSRLAAVGGTDLSVVLGRGSRGLYITGVGAVFAVDMDLVNTPSIGPFKTTISPEEKAAVHKRKIAHLAMLETSMREMMAGLGQSASLKGLPASDQIVLGVRLMCAPWEDTTGLPGQIVMKADRQGGNIRMELQ
jgi:hypothetical protein